MRGLNASETVGATGATGEPGFTGASGASGNTGNWRIFTHFYTQLKALEQHKPAETFRFTDFDCL